MRPVTPAMIRSRSRDWRPDSLVCRSRAMRIATPRPTTPATFSVPVRRPFSCPPPVWVVPIDADHRQTRLAVRRKIPCGIDHRVVLDRGGDEPVAAVLDLEPAAEREIVGLGASAGEDDLAGMGTDRVCDLLARAVHEGSRCPSLGVDARR